jgi:hypothetical protein
VTAPAVPQAHQLAWMAAGLRRAARTLGVELPVGYSEAVAANGIAICEQLGVTRLDHGVAIHTAPESPDQLPVLIGYADAAGQWYRDGRRHSTLSVAPAPGVEATPEVAL